jgi:hypothetical protein
MASNFDTVKRFVEVMIGKQTRLIQSGHVFGMGNVLYSYGQHFPLMVYTKQNKFIINADKYSHTTDGHTRDCISAVPQAPCIPFNSIRAIDQNARLETIVDQLNLIEIGEPFYTQEIKRLNKKDWDIKDVAERIKTSDWKLIKEDDKTITVTQPVHHLGYTLFEYQNRHFLSGMDDRHYFLCELLDKHQTVNETLRSMAGNLNDEEYKDYQKGLIKRQGEFFFIPIEGIDTKAIKTLIKKKAPIPQAQGTASHIANSLVQFTNSNKVYVKGYITHSRGDHKSVFLDSWHLVVMNTVKQSWTSSGRVD